MKQYSIILFDRRTFVHNVVLLIYILQFCWIWKWSLTKKISQFLFLGMEDFLVLYPPKNLFIALHHGSHFILIIKPRFCYISIFEFIKVYYTNDLMILHLSQSLTFSRTFLRVNVCLLWVNNRVLSLVSN